MILPHYAFDVINSVNEPVQELLHLIESTQPNAQLNNVSTVNSVNRMWSLVTGSILVCVQMSNYVDVRRFRNWLSPTPLLLQYVIEEELINTWIYTKHVQLDSYDCTLTTIHHSVIRRWIHVRNASSSSPCKGRGLWRLSIHSLRTFIRPGH